MAGFEPKFEGAIEGFVVNYLKRNYWRVQNLMTVDEIMQEARIVFLRLSRKYPSVDTPQHFMSLFKTAFTRRMNTFSNKDTEKRKPEICFSDVLTEEQDPNFLLNNGCDYNEGYLAVLIDEAPEEVMGVLSLMLNCPRELMDLLIAVWRMKGKKKEHGKEFLCEVLGHDSDVDLVAVVEEYFTNDNIYH